MKKDKLDQFTLDIEFLLISIVQGVAIAALGAEAVKVLANSQWQFIPYIIAGFLFILIFWSGAIIHAVSFIDWPLDLTHNFFYFLASLIEVIAFGFMDSPLLWFITIFFFFLAAELLYVIDYKLILKRKNIFESKAQIKLYNNLLSEQKFELSTIVPAGILFNAVAVLLIYTYPKLFLEQNYQLVLISLQILFSFGFLLLIIKSFKKRSLLISEAA
jgi:hypothetical protein